MCENYVYYKTINNDPKQRDKWQRSWDYNRDYRLNQNDVKGEQPPAAASASASVSTELKWKLNMKKLQIHCHQATKDNSARIFRGEN